MASSPVPGNLPANPEPTAVPARRRAAHRRLVRWLGGLTLICILLTGAGLVGTGPALGTPAAAEVTDPAPVASSEFGYRWPLDGAPLVIRGFQPPPRPWQAGHRGVDLASQPANQPDVVVRAAGPGTVHFAGRLAGRGVVSIRHRDGLRTTYEPVEPLVAAGQEVAAGDVIGRLVPGHHGCPVTACLHWGVRDGDGYLDPLSLLGLGRVRLLPMTAASATGQA